MHDSLFSCHFTILTCNWISCWYYQYLRLHFCSQPILVVLLVCYYLLISVSAPMNRGIVNQWGELKILLQSCYFFLRITGFISCIVTCSSTHHSPGKFVYNCHCSCICQAFIAVVKFWKLIFKPKHISLWKQFSCGPNHVNFFLP